MRWRFFLIFLFSVYNIYSQKQENVSSFPYSSSIWTVKTNFLYNATTSFNLGTEFKVQEKLSLDISANYNPWTFSDNKKFKHFMIQPELRYWLCEPFNGHFFGLQMMYAHYNVGGVKLSFLSKQKLENTRYQGDLYGAGISYGYQWYLSPRWNLEATIGLGYAYLDYSAYACSKCGNELYQKNRSYVGPTKLGLSLIYIIK
ncbi:DUF3575 domain-containing protein [Massilibacteroides sp.]|uniref:DUF3575 domain-containing protein n=1 Tax=Massilibacteroides sp. TaxID=2034766 RepID=UPI00262A5B02|nr:DUF3575 domain-containing protein [Massilibacteroides sp.]MDD4516683.1 DUF3575 domain-containing protein [Massilibacteroides sp.]